MNFYVLKHIATDSYVKRNYSSKKCIDDSLTVNPQVLTKNLKKARVWDRSYNAGSFLKPGSWYIGRVVQGHFGEDRQKTIIKALKRYGINLVIGDSFNYNHHDKFEKQFSTEWTVVEITDVTLIKLPKKYEVKDKINLLKFYKVKGKARVQFYDQSRFTSGYHRPSCSCCGVKLVEIPAVNYTHPGMTICCMCLAEAYNSVKSMIDPEWMKTVQKERFLHKI